jgi:hypothetical protein
MRTIVLSIVGASVLFLVGATPALSANCPQIMKRLQMGEDPKDIAELMAIDPAEIEKCKAEPAQKPKAGEPATNEKPAAEKKPAGGDMH